MKNNIFTIFAIFMVAVFSSCSEHEAEENALATIKDYEVAGNIKNDGQIPLFFNLSNGEKIAGYGKAEISAEKLISVQATDGFKAIEELKSSFMANTSEKSFAYNHANNKVTVKIVFSQKHGGKTYTQENLDCNHSFTIEGVHKITSTQEDPFVEKSQTVYTLKGKDYVMGEALQEFEVVAPEAEDVLQSVSFSWKHNAFVKNAEFANNIITGLCDNTASWHEIWTVSGKKNEVETSFQMKHSFSYTSAKKEVDDLTAIVGKTFNFVNGEVAAIGAKVAHTGSEIVGKLNYNNKSYNDSVEVCKVTAKSITVVSATEGIVKFYDNNAEDYFEVTIPLQVTEKARLISQIEKFVHDAYRKAATFANNVITVICDNHMDVTKTYSDNTTTEDEVKYMVSNLYDITMPKFILNDSKSIVGISVNFDNGIAEVLGQNVVVKHRSMNVSDIVYDNKNYVNDSRRPNCQPTAKTITFVSSEEAVISFEDEGEIVAEAKVPVSVKVAINFDGILVKGWATDSYIDGGQGVAAHEGTYFHFVVNKNGAYTMYSAKVKENISVADFTATSVSENFVNTLSNDKPAAFTGKSASTYDLGYINKVVKYSEDTYIIQYYNSNGKLDRTVGQSGAAIGSNYRYPIRGTWSEDVISVEGTQFYITGSQN